MKSGKTALPTFLSTLQNRTSLFLILAFLPLLLIMFYSPFSAIIPLYGFLLLYLKNTKLTTFKRANLIQEIIGLIIVASSFFVYYLAILVYPEVAFYSPANYTIYLLGLFLTFFELPALKEAFSPLFLIVAATSSTFISNWLRPFISPFTNDFAHIVTGILTILGVRSYLFNYGEAPMIAITSVSGNTVFLSFIYECIGVYSMLVFSIILIVILFEDPSPTKVKTAYAIVGLIGTFALNIVRVTIVFLASYFLGADVGGTVHYVAGYILFTIWLVFFLYIYSKRQTIHAKIRSIYKKEHQPSTLEPPQISPRNPSQTLVNPQETLDKIWEATFNRRLPMLFIKKQVCSRIPTT